MKISSPGLNIEITTPKGIIILGGSCESSCTHSFTAKEDGVYKITFENVYSEDVTLFLEWDRSGSSSGSSRVGALVVILLIIIIPILIIIVVIKKIRNRKK